MLVWQNTVLDDRLFSPGSRVTAGSNPKATYWLEDSGNGASAVLRPSREGAEVVLFPGLRGELTISGQTRPVAQWLDSPSANAAAKGGTRLLLSLGDGGVLVFGQTGFGFEVVSFTERLPPSRVGQVLGTDAMTGRLFSLLLAMAVLFSFVSRLFAGTRPEMTIEQLPDRFATIIASDAESIKRFRDDMSKRREEKKQQVKEKSGPEIKPRPSNGNQKAASEDERIRQKVARKGVVGALSMARREGPLKQVLEEGGLGMDLNQAVKALDRGAARARVLAARGGVGGEGLPSLIDRSASGTGTGEELNIGGPTTGEAGRAAAGRRRLGERTEAEVQVDIPSSQATVSGGDLSRDEIFKVVTRNKNAIRYCYESQLMRYPTLRGKITVDFIIEADGKVQTVRIQQNTLTQATAAESVASCLMRFIRRWRFPEPRGGKVRVIYPFTFGRKG